VFEVVEIVTVDDPAVVPVMLTGVVAEQVAGLVAATGVTAQVKATLPVNPLDGVRVIVAVLPEVAPAWKVIAPLLLRAKLGGGFTVTLTGVDDVILPVAASAPVTVIV
jgi:Zn-dependent protease